MIIYCDINEFKVLAGQFIYMDDGYVNYLFMYVRKASVAPSSWPVKTGLWTGKNRQGKESRSYMGAEAVS